MIVRNAQCRPDETDNYAVFLIVTRVVIYVQKLHSNVSKTGGRGNVW